MSCPKCGACTAWLGVAVRAAAPAPAPRGSASTPENCGILIWRFRLGPASKICLPFPRISTLNFAKRGHSFFDVRQEWTAGCGHRVRTGRGVRAGRSGACARQSPTRRSRKRKRSSPCATGRVSLCCPALQKRLSTSSSQPEKRIRGHGRPSQSETRRREHGLDAGLVAIPRYWGT